MKPRHSTRLSASFAVLLPLFMTSHAVAESPISTSDRVMIETVDQAMPDAIVLLERLVNQNSGTQNLDGVTRVGAMVRAELDAIGFRTTWKPQTEVGRAGHLLATHPGAPGKKRLLLIGHLDTVFEPSSPFQRFVRTGDQASGPGAGDNKGGIVVMLTALRAMAAAGTLRHANIEIALTGDEESVGRPQAIARADLIAAAERAEVALDFEGLMIESGADMASISRRSANSFILTATGNSAHSSVIFSDKVGDGAVFEMARILTEFRKELPEPYLTFNIGLVGGGAAASFDAGDTSLTASGKPNIVPGVAVASGDFRTIDEAQSERVRAKMTAIVARNAPGTSAKIEFRSAYPPMAPTAGNEALLMTLNQVNAVLGLAPMRPLDPLKRGAGDINFIAGGIDGLAGLGAASRGDHTPDETVDLNSLPRQAKRAALLMTRLAQEKRRN